MFESVAEASHLRRQVVGKEFAQPLQPFVRRAQPLDSSFESEKGRKAPGAQGLDVRNESLPYRSATSNMSRCRYSPAPVDSQSARACADVQSSAPPGHWFQYRKCVSLHRRESIQPHSQYDNLSRAA